MTTPVLDTTELSRDFFYTGLAYQLLQGAPFTWLNVFVPQWVLEHHQNMFGEAISRCGTRQDSAETVIGRSLEVDTIEAPAPHQFR